MKVEIGDNVRIITQGFDTYGHFLNVGDIVTVIDVGDTCTTVIYRDKILQMVEESDYEVIK